MADDIIEQIEEKEAMTGKRKLFISAIILLSIGLTVAIVMILLQVLPAKKLDAPTNLKVYSAGGRTYAQVEEQPKAEKYIFYVNSGQYIVQSESNIVDLSFITEPDYYAVQVSAVGKDATSKSPMCQAQGFSVTTKLETPNVDYYDGTKTKLVWSAVANAARYIISFNDQKKTETATQFDLTTLPAGKYSIVITAAGNSSKYTESDASETIIYERIVKLANPTATFNGTKIIINKVENATGYTIRVDNKDYFVKAFSTNSFEFDPAMFNSNYGEDDYYEVKITATGDTYYSSSDTTTIEFNRE